MAQNQHTAFDRIEFPPYEYREFPMAVPVDEDGNPVKDPYVSVGTKGKRVLRPVVIVNDEAELQALMGPGVSTVEVGPGAARVRTDDDERNELYEQAQTRGIVVDRSWPVARIKAALEQGPEVV